jgi:transcriptional regulator of acetoin/glycerol metabolism
MVYHWPGNIRELENVVERAFILCDKVHIGIVHLPEELTAYGNTKIRASRSMRSAKDLLDAHAIRNALAHNDNNRMAAARELGIHKSTLFRKIKKLGLVMPEKDEL